MKTLMVPKSVLVGLAIFLVIRVAIILAAGESAPPDTTDHEVYHNGAVRLVADTRNWVQPGSEFGYRAPGNFVYIATAMTLTGSKSYAVSQISCAILGVFSCFLLYLLTRTVGGETAGQIAFWLRGLLPNYVLTDTYAMSEQLFAVFFVSILLLLATALRKPGVRQAALLGALVAACMLSREAGVIYIAFFVAYLALSHHPRKQRFMNVGVMLVAITIVITPWMMRNVVVWGKPLPLSYEASMGLRSGNNDNFTGEWVPLDWPDDIQFGTPEFSDYNWRVGMAYIIEDPVRFVRRGFVKLAWWLWPRFQRHHLEVVYPSMGNLTTPVAAISGLASGAVLLFGALGFFSMRPNIFWSMCLALTLVAVAASMATGGDPRFRDPIEYILVMSCGVLLSNSKIRDLPGYIRANMNTTQLSLVAVCWIATVSSWIWVLNYKLGS